MTPSDFATLRKTHGSQRVMGPRLGVHWRTIQKIESGEFGDPVPVKYELMLRGWIAAKDHP